VKTCLECIPCFVRQTLDAVRMVTDDEVVHESLLRTVLRDVSAMNLRQTPPEMAQRIHRLVREVSGDSDPYRVVKSRFNKLAISVLPDLRRRVAESSSPLDTAVRLAIAGNVIDFGIQSNISERNVHEAVDHALTEPFDGDIEGFAAEVENARSILYLADNTGEIAFDRLLIEQLPADKVTVGVRGCPIINDATLEDARAVGLTDLVAVIDNGSDAPGTILDDCSAAFRERFDNADLVIAKGQGNYETLSEVPASIFFALEAKCPVIAGDIGCEVGSLIFRRSDASTEQMRSRV